MYKKDQNNDQIDSGLGDSFGSFEETGTVSESMKKLEINDPKTELQNKEEHDKLVQFLRHAFTPDEDNDTYLHLFIARSLEEKAIQLVELCPQREILNIQNNLGQTALHVATYVNFYKVAVELVLHGADLELVDKDGRNIFHLCAQRGHTESLEAIVRAACQTKQIKKVHQLLNERDFYGLTPFYLSVCNKHENMCKKLVDMNADVNRYDMKNGNAPLHEAVLDPECNSSFVKFLINTCKVNVNSQNYAGVTPLHCASGRTNESLFAMLLLYGGNPNITDIRGNTPVVYGNEKILSLVSK